MVKTALTINQTNTCLQSGGVELPLRDGARLAARPNTRWFRQRRIRRKRGCNQHPGTLTAIAEPATLEAYLQEGSPGDSNLQVHSRRANRTKLTPHRVTYHLLDNKMQLHENEVVALATYLRTHLAVPSRVQPWTLGGLVRKTWLNLPRTRHCRLRKSKHQRISYHATSRNDTCENSRALYPRAHLPRLIFSW